MQSFFPLHSLALSAEVPELQAALSKGVQFSKQDAHGNLLLHCAVATNRIEVLEVVLNSGAPVGLPNRLGLTALQFAFKLVRLPLPLPLYLPVGSF